jgi:hypothetical protein
VRPILVIGSLSVLLAACSTSADSSSSPGGAEPVPDWPLTGVASSDASVDVEGPAVVVKVDNVPDALPQTGLGAADIIVEEPVEGGVTRLAVFFHSQIGGSTGPVRSVRSSDVGIVKPAEAVLVASGGAAPALADIEQADIDTRLDGSAPGFSRDDSRVVPHNLFVDVGELYAELDSPGPPGEYFDFAEAAGLPDGEPAEAVVLTFSPAQTTRLDETAGGWERVLDTPDGFSADTVVALVVEQGTADYLDPSGAPVPINLTEGSGSGWLAHDGEVIEIEWSKESAGDRWTFTSDEESIGVPPGRTYLALLPVATGSLQVVSPETTRGDG